MNLVDLPSLLSGFFFFCFFFFFEKERTATLCMDEPEVKHSMLQFFYGICFIRLVSACQTM